MNALYDNECGGFHSKFIEKKMNLAHDNFRILFDQNILSRFVNGNNDDFINNVYNEIELKTGRRVKIDRYFPITLTPFGVFELLGLKLPTPSSDVQMREREILKSSAEINSKLRELLNLIQDFYLASENLSMLNFKQRLMAMRRKESKAGKYFFDIIDSQLFARDGFHKDLITFLSNDYIQGISYPFKESILLLIHYSFDLANNLSHGNNRSVLRGLSKSFESLQKREVFDESFLHTIEEKAIYRNLVRSVSTLMRVENGKDLLDCDIAHLATFGFSDSKGSCPLFALTKDSPDQVLTRVKFLKSIVIAQKNAINFPRFKYGAIGFVDERGQVYRVEKVKDIK